MFLNTLPVLKNELSVISSRMEELIPEEWKKEEVGSIIDSVMEGRGKGYRPALLMLIGRMGESYSECRERLFTMGALVEFVHMASLIHDDIIDDSLLRRGVPTIQAKYGKEAAVFCGDLILSKVMSVLLTEGYTESGILLSKTIQDMCIGEINQAACRYKKDVTVEEYYHNIYGKTASMFVTTCKIGALESGASKEMVDRLGELGENLGYLFQIRDDLLDFLTINKEDGKPVRMDFREGILTLPVIFTLQDPEYRARVEELIDLNLSGSLTDQDLDHLDELIRKSGGFEKTVSVAGEHEKKIMDILDSFTCKETVGIIKHVVSMLKLPKL